jgi:hypothetical protein
MRRSELGCREGEHMGRVQDVDYKSQKRFLFHTPPSTYESNQPYAPADASRECTARSPLLAAWLCRSGCDQESSSPKHSARHLREVLNWPYVMLSSYFGGPLIFSDVDKPHVSSVSSSTLGTDNRNHRQRCWVTSAPPLPTQWIHRSSYNPRDIHYQEVACAGSAICGGGDFIV